MASSCADNKIEKINSLKCFLTSVEERVKVITNQLNWNLEKLTEGCESSLVTCSVQPEHKVHCSRIKEHEDRCQWTKDGYHELDKPFPQSSGVGSCVVFTPELQETVIRNACPTASDITGKTRERDVPQTSARLDQEFSREEKLALYDYVIANTKSQKVSMDFSSFSLKEDKVEKKVMTPLEIAAAERDAKRRRASYRNKVHTNRKTQTEILREVIESQMDALKEEISNQNESHTEKEYQGKSTDGFLHESEYCSSKMGFSKEGRADDRFSRSQSKFYDYKDHSKYQSKHRYDRDLRDSRHKKSKKRSRSRSRSHERNRHKKSYSHSDYSYKNSYRY